MRKTIFALLACVVTTLSAVTLADTNAVGIWAGTWEGAGGNGSFKITLKRDAKGQLSGGVSVGQDTGDYEATFTSVTLDGNALTAKYDYTPDPQAEIALTATLDGNAMKGKWGMLPKGQTTEMAAGTWTVTKQ